MPKISGYTALMWSVCATLIVLALTLIFSSHKHLSELSEESASHKGQLIASHFNRSLSGADADSSTMDLLIESTRLIDDLAYLVVSDEKGAVVAAVNERGARRFGYNFPKEFTLPETENTVFKVSENVSLGSRGGEGILYIGLEREKIEAGMQKDKQYFLVVGSLLVFIALVLLTTIKRFHFVEVSISKLHQARRALAAEKGSLESEVSVHREKEATLKESEERYRTLLASTMQAAFDDLERQKISLEKEVEEKTQTQKLLRRTTRRLRALNTIERKLVEEAPVEEIAQYALKELEGLIPVTVCSVLEIHHNTETVSVLASQGVQSDKFGPDAPIPLSKFRTFRRGLFVARDLSRMGERAPIEDKLVESGILCYCRVSLTIDDVIAGALNVGMKNNSGLDEEALKVIRDVADLVSIGFRQHRHKIEREKYQEELIAERDRAEEMARLKTAFLTNMTHEIRTPLSGIIGFAQVLHEEIQDEKREFANLVQEAAKRLMSTINSVLDLSRLEANKEAFHLKEMDVSSVVRETTRVLEPLAARKDLEFRIDTHGPAEARLDRNALEAILNNLVGNAIKFTEKGFVSVSVTGESGGVVIEVQDSGMGISDSFLPHIFDEFRQEYMEADRPHEGSGLGLAITSRLVKKLGGIIDVKSEVGVGTIFRVSFAAQPQLESVKRDAAASPSRAARTKSTTPEAVS